MKISTYYSHLNGYEWLHHHYPELWDEISDTVSSIQAEKSKISEEDSMRGRPLYNPPELNAEFEEILVKKHRWFKGRRHNYYVTDDEDVTRSIINEPSERQYQIIKDAGKEPINTYNAPDFTKNRVSLEIQFGKYSFVQFDIFIKHAANFMQNRIDLGIEIVPMKAMEREMSSGPPYYEKHLHEIIRQGRIWLPVPLILIGIEP